MTKLILLILLTVALSGCAHVSKDGRTFIGWGNAKIEDGKIVEISSDPPIKIDMFRK